MVIKNGGGQAAAVAAQQAAFNMQTMQLEWLARTGMLYHRFPELAGEKEEHNSQKKLLSA
jgi:hypothetical protein